MVKRRFIQIIAAIGSNAYLKGFFEGTIYQGNIKKICVPGLNCYSCPGSLGSCPIGSLQAVIGSFKYNFSLYIIGLVSLFGLIFGRLICGYLCPFGFFQELIYKIPLPKLKVNHTINRLLSYIKYILLITLVILFPMFLVDEIGIASPFFCQYVCPAGTLEGGIPLLLFNESLRDMIGILFFWKMFILILVIIFSIIIYRAFCKYLCPLGAIYSIFNKISFFKYYVDENKCIKCKKCSEVCKMGVEMYKNPNGLECIRCGDCKKVCPKNAIKSGFFI